MSINWIHLTQVEQIEEIKERSKLVPQMIYKHSTRCGTSYIVRSRLEKNQPLVFIEFYFLDLIKYRAISNKIADEFKVHHESPQVLLIRNEECVYEESHMGIRMEEMVNLVGNL